MSRNWAGRHYRLYQPSISAQCSDRAIYREGKRYIDYHAAFGPPILGHCHPAVSQRVGQTMSEIDLVGVGATELEIQLAQKIVSHIPCAEKVMFCNSGSGATFSALRLARGTADLR